MFICYMLIVQHLYKRLEFLRLWYWGLEPGPQDVKEKDPSRGSIRTKVGSKQFFHTWRSTPSVSLSSDTRREKLYSPWLCQLWSQRIRSSCFTPPVSFCRDSYCSIHNCPLQHNRQNNSLPVENEWRGTSEKWVSHRVAASSWLAALWLCCFWMSACVLRIQTAGTQTGLAKPAEGEFLALLCYRTKGCVTEWSQEEHPGCCWYLHSFYHFIN